MQEWDGLSSLEAKRHMDQALPQPTTRPTSQARGFKITVLSSCVQDLQGSNHCPSFYPGRTSHSPVSQ